MRKLVSPTTGTIVKINVEVGQEIAEGDDVLIIKAVDHKAASYGQAAPNAKDRDEHEEFSRHHNLYEYSCNESLDLLAKLISDCQEGQKEVSA